MSTIHTSIVKTLYIDVYTIVSSFRVELDTLHNSMFQYMYKVTELEMNCAVQFLFVLALLKKLGQSITST